MSFLRVPVLSALLLLSGPGPSVADDVAEGEAVFANRCSDCHRVKPDPAPVAGERAKLGPSLHGLFGRTAGTLPGYSYSEAMKASGVVWDAETLEIYLKDPKAFVPKNKMPFNGLKRDGEAEKLIAYLQVATQ